MKIIQFYFRHLRNELMRICKCDFVLLATREGVALLGRNVAATPRCGGGLGDEVEWCDGRMRAGEG